MSPFAFLNRNKVPKGRVAELLSDWNDGKAIAAYELEKICSSKDRQVVAALIDHLVDSDSEMRAAASHALLELSPLHDQDIDRLGSMLDQHADYASWIFLILEKGNDHAFAPLLNHLGRLTAPQDIRATFDVITHACLNSNQVGKLGKAITDMQSAWCTDAVRKEILDLVQWFAKGQAEVPIRMAAYQGAEKANQQRAFYSLQAKIIHMFQQELIRFLAYGGTFKEHE